ncbi:MAG: glycosyltransferase family 2 protein [Phycisphaerae bacterium]|nr:glycosyltransferase family 2 protein [Phycisphaerae bacterium]
MNLLDALTTELRCPNDRTALVLRTPPGRLPDWRCPSCRTRWALATEVHELARGHHSLRDAAPDPRDIAPATTPQAPAMPEISVVLPALDEAQALPTVLARIADALADADYEVVVVDDGSRDQTAAAAQRTLIDGRVTGRVVRLTRRFGHQAALLAGLRHARGRAVITMDADGQHPPEILPDLLRAWRRGARVVQTIRRDDERLPRLKRWTSRGFYRLFSRCCEASIAPGTADFRLLDRAVVDTILAARGPTPFLRGLIPWLGFPTQFVTYDAGPRIGGASKFSLRAMLRLAAHGCLSFSIYPLRAATILGLALAALALLDVAYIVIVALFNRAVVPGWASIAGLVATIGAVQLLCVGVLGEYVGRLYSVALDRPPYVVSEIRESRTPGPNPNTRTVRAYGAAPMEPSHVG